jgi:hypothetical protein
MRRWHQPSSIGPMPWSVRLSLGAAITVGALLVSSRIDNDRTFSTGDPASGEPTVSTTPRDGRIVLAPGPNYVCRWEDMLPLRLLVDGFGHHAGEIVCIHIDQLDDMDDSIVRPPQTQLEGS